MGEELVELSRSNYIDNSESMKTFTMIDIIWCLAEVPMPTITARLEELTRSKNHFISTNARRAMKLQRAGKL
jgi:hypothetical protein